MSNIKKVDNLWITFLTYGRVLLYNNYNYMINVQITKIVKVGTSLGVIVPINILRDLQILRGDQVAFSIAAGDVICLRKITDAEKLEIKPLPIIQI